MFTLLNENGVNIRIAIASFGCYFVIALVALFLMGDYEKILMATAAHEKEEFLFDDQMFSKRSRSENDLSQTLIDLQGPDFVGISSVARSRSFTSFFTLK